MIELKNISKDFGSGEKAVHAVRDVSLSIGSGEIFGIIGFSGAGKSTLVRCINLLERPSSGSVFVAGQDLTALSAKDLRAARKKIGMIFQHFNLMPSRTVAGNVAYPLKGSGLSKEDIQKKVATLLELVGIGDKADAYPSQLSGGQKQRVAIARALANDPQVLLCDEATSALDPQTTKAILHLLKHLNETLGITIVLITHEMAVVKEICDRVAVMEYGRVVEQGEVFTVFAEPKQDITKSFIHTTSRRSKSSSPRIPPSRVSSPASSSSACPTFSATSTSRSSPPCRRCSTSRSTSFSPISPSCRIPPSAERSPSSAARESRSRKRSNT